VRCEIILPIFVGEKFLEIWDLFVPVFLHTAPWKTGDTKRPSYLVVDDQLVVDMANIFSMTVFISQVDSAVKN
jgi:hypothetical protein